MIRAFAASHPGKKRNSNQDAYFCSPHHGLFVVADGMGGHQGGQIAAQIVVKSFLSNIPKLKVDNNCLGEIISNASGVIYKTSSTNEKYKGMGTTCTACIVKEEKDKFQITFGHVGDSRLYFIVENRMWKLTKDHTLLNEQVDSGMMSREDAEKKIAKNVLVRSVGISPEIDVDLSYYNSESGAWILLCSDGLCNMLNDDMILRTVMENIKNLKKSVTKLIDLANEAGGEDNITAVLVRLESK